MRKFIYYSTALALAVLLSPSAASAASINTTRSNIKSANSISKTGAGSSNQINSASINTTRSNIKNSVRSIVVTEQSANSGNASGDGNSGSVSITSLTINSYAIKENGVR